jgi:protease-4
MTELQVPYYEQWIGPWAILPDALTQTLELFRKTDLHIHLQQQAARKGDRTLLCEAPSGPFRQKGPVPFSRSDTTGDVAMISLTGKLMKQQASMGGGTSTVQARRDIRAAASDPDIGAILLRIDSPGGTAAGTKELADEIAAAKAKKPVWAYVEDMAASAAYWAASQASRIIANETALIGSIGTYGVVQDTSGMAAMEGVKVHVIRAGAFKGAGTPGTEITAEHLTEMQRTVDGLNEYFLAGVTAGRSMLTAARVRELADGRAYLAAEAKTLGLIDAIGSFDQALSELQSQVKPRREPMQTSLVETAVDAALAIEVPPAAPQPQLAKPPVAGPASYQELVAGCVGADPAFLCSQLAAGATLAQAQTAWMTEQNRRIVAAQQRPGVEAVGTKATGKSSPSIDPDAIANWNALIEAEQQTGKTLAQATRACVVQHPDAHLAYLAAFNASVPCD